MKVLLGWFGCLVLVLVPVMARADAGKSPVAIPESEAPVSSEDTWVSRIDVGGRTGLALASVAGPGTNEMYVSYSFKLGLTIGGSVGVRVTNAIAAQAEINFTTKGPYSKIDGVDSGSYFLRYVEIPFLARIALPVPGQIDYYATGGPTVSILLDAKLHLTDGSSHDLGRSLEPVDIGVMLGVGAAMAVGGEGSIALDLRYSRGLSNIDKTSTSSDGDIMNQAFYFTVGYRANLDDLLHGFRRKAPTPARKVPPASHAPEPDAAATDTPAPDTEPAPTEPMSPLDKPHAHPPDRL